MIKSVRNSAKNDEIETGAKKNKNQTVDEEGELSPNELQDGLQLENIFLPDCESQVKVVFYLRKQNNETIFAEQSIDLTHFLIPVRRWADLNKTTEGLEVDSALHLNSVGGVQGECKVRFSIEFETFYKQNSFGFMCNSGFTYRLPLVNPEWKTGEKTDFQKNLEKSVSVFEFCCQKLKAGNGDKTVLADCVGTMIDNQVLLSFQLEKSDVNWGNGFYYPSIEALMNVQELIIIISGKIAYALPNYHSGKIGNQFIDTLRLLLEREEIELSNLTISTKDSSLEDRQTEIATSYLTLFTKLIETAITLLKAKTASLKTTNLAAFLIAYVFLRFEPIKLAIMTKLRAGGVWQSNLQQTSYMSSQWINLFLDHFSKSSSKFASEKAGLAANASTIVDTIFATSQSLNYPFASEYLKMLQAKYLVRTEFEFMEFAGFQAIFQRLLRSISERNINTSDPLAVECLVDYCLNKQTTTQIMYRVLETTK